MLDELILAALGIELNELSLSFLLFLKGVVLTEFLTEEGFLTLTLPIEGTEL